MDHYFILKNKSVGLLSSRKHESKYFLRLLSFRPMKLKTVTLNSELSLKINERFLSKAYKDDTGQHTFLCQEYFNDFRVF